MQEIKRVRPGRLGWWKTGCAVVALWAACAIAAPAQTFITMQSFTGANGAGPYAALVQANDGTLHGTTVLGGANGDGAAFKISPDNVFTFLYSFCSQSGCADGINPYAPLAVDTNGYLYGTTTSDGANGAYGTIFQISPANKVTTVLSLDGTNGQQPYGALVQATNGNLYGTTGYGGANSSGTVFSLTTKGLLKTLYSFCSQSGCADGEIPYGGLVQGSDGNLYGTAELGGVYSDGTAFKITPAGVLKTLYSFCSKAGCTDGSNPWGGLIQATDGNFYGTTLNGGANSAGTIFRLTPTGKLTTIYTFCSQTNCADGANPYAGVVQANDGNFYGTTPAGGANNAGTIFKITKAGVLTTLYNFCSQSGCADGSGPFARLVQDTNGSFYGVTSSGGTGTACTGGCGTIFRLVVGGLSAFVRPLTTSGKVGSTVLLQGSKLTGSTSVTFNGTPATFTVTSETLITTAVPAGATSGNIQVVTPRGTVSSNVPFTVVP